MIQTETIAEILEHAANTPREYAVRAKCIIKIGDVCTAYFPTHDCAETYTDHLAYHEQNARVVKLHNEGSVDIQMTSGSNTGEIVTNVNPMNLFFWGPFVAKVPHDVNASGYWE